MVSKKVSQKGAVSAKKMNKVSLRVENIVVSVNLHEKIPLEKLLEKYRDIQQKDNFPGLVVKINKPKATILFFSSGKLVMTGITLVEHIPIILEKILKKLSDAEIEISEEPSIKVENIVVRGDFHKKINLDLTSLLLDRAIYEPEVFPGLIYKIVEPNAICFLIFSSGRIICTGAKNIEIIKTEVKNLGLLLKKEKVLGNEDLEESENTEMLDLFWFLNNNVNSVKKIYFPQSTFGIKQINIAGWLKSLIYPWNSLGGI